MSREATLRSFFGPSWLHEQQQSLWHQEPSKRQSARELDEALRIASSSSSSSSSLTPPPPPSLPPAPIASRSLSIGASDEQAKVALFVEWFDTHTPDIRAINKQNYAKVCIFTYIHTHTWACISSHTYMHAYKYTHMHFVASLLTLHAHSINIHTHTHTNKVLYGLDITSIDRLARQLRAEGGKAQEWLVKAGISGTFTHTHAHMHPYNTHFHIHTHILTHIYIDIHT